MRSTGAILFCAILISIPARGELVLSEILANEPGDRVLLEWLEIFNNGPFPIEMNGYLLVENGDTLDFPFESAIEPDNYAVFCRRLEPIGGSDCFEYHWGDSTGVWGDSPLESYAAYEIGISLANSSGTIYLMTSNFQFIDSCTWDELSDDGRSLERADVTDSDSPWRACYDPAGSTPGRANSESPLPDQDYFLQIEPQVISRLSGNRSVVISYAAPPGSKVSLAIYDDTALKRADLLIADQSSVGEIIWDLTGGDGQLLAPGLYMIVFKLEGAVAKRKVLPVVIAP